MRPSRYALVSATVFRHPSGRVVRPVLHTRTARVFLADLGTAARLEAATGTEGESGAEGERRLAAAGLLVEAERDEAAEVLAAGRDDARDRRVREFVLMPTAYCNMGCGYCGQRHERLAAGAAHRSAVARRVERATTSGRYDTVAVRWFGGEPLMGYAVLRDLSTCFVAATEAAGVGYTAKLITNGTLLDARKLRVLHRQCRIDRIEVTLDGPAEVHDAARPLKRGGGSFRRIVEVLGSALDDPELGGLRFTVRTNVGRHNATLAEEFAATLATAGLAHDRVLCYPAPIHSWGNQIDDVAVTGEAMAAVELEWFLAYRRHGLRFPLLPSGPRTVVCAATTRHSEVIAPDGRVYGCTEQPLVPGAGDDHLGHVSGMDAAAPRPTGAYDDWYDAVNAGETPCRTCAILPLCGGACPKLWREGKSPCPPLRDNVLQRLDLYALDAGYLPIVGS
ncbi:radical SAM protein [Actinoplanes sp. NBRC 103695]|uniref:radical SAM/SPASM domain-containing protein n=1 Tax=Actinoplanes sp. NBRC 103695 TaxID=3032202 RepID=UPI0024A464A3|nr:radical SAM protein [Actinoplanes sp. NBRC 103695]GLY94054.1 radical SAM/SPASM domain-containing protein [Actinoplanes sp. NBRC 103695]